MTAYDRWLDPPDDDEDGDDAIAPDNDPDDPTHVGPPDYEGTGRYHYPY